MTERINTSARSTDHLYFTAAEAAAFLGISPASLYAYVSRKKIRSFQDVGSRVRRYWKADVLALGETAKRRQRGGPAGTRRTAITLLTEDRTYYRGHDVTSLADTHSVEDVAAILWQGEASQIFTDRLPEMPGDYAEVFHALRFSLPYDRAMALAPLVERANPRAFDLSPSGFAQTGAHVLRWLTATILNQRRTTADPIDARIACVTGCTDAVRDLVRRALILMADHEFGDTTRAVRAAANVGLTPYSAVLVGMIAGTGQNVRVNRTEAVRRLLLDVLRSNQPERPVVELYRSGFVIPGFETLPQHRNGDARAAALMAQTARVFGEDAEFRRLDRAITVTRDLTGQDPGLVVPLLFLGHKLGLEDREAAVGLIGRAIGWIAHAQEELQEKRPSRPEADYIGELPSRD